VSKECEDVATVKFGKELSSIEKKKFEEYIRLYGPCTDVEWGKERTD